MPPDLLDFYTSRAFWTDHGIKSEPDLDDWDEDRVQRWLIIMDVIAKHERAQIEAERRKAQHEAGGG